MYNNVVCVQFYIKDTKSSNGTFVNESRLSPSGEESGLVELKSRDILQFGVNVNVERRGPYYVCIHICVFIVRCVGGSKAPPVLHSSYRTDFERDCAV